MANTYLTGTSLGGVVVDSATAALEQIKDFALLAGWSLTTGDYDSLPMVLRSGKSIAGIHAFYRFTSPDVNTITIRGDTGGSGTELSPNSNNQLTSIATGSRIWISAKDDAALGIYSKPTSADGRVQQLGWLDDPLDDLNPYGWGLFDGNSTLHAPTNISRNKVIARVYNSTTAWNGAPVTGTSILGFYAVNIATNSTSAFNSSPAGIKPVLFRIPVTDSSNNLLGYLPFIINGLMGGSAGSIVQVPSTEIRYICTGANQAAMQVAG